VKKLVALFCLILALLASPVSSAFADIVPPSTPAILMIWNVNGQLLVTDEYAVTQIQDTAGNVYTLDTSDGSNYTLDISLDGTSSFVTKWLNGTIVWQWIGTEE
jgi:hypothetical protein